MRRSTAHRTRPSWSHRPRHLVGSCTTVALLLLTGACSSSGSKGAAPSSTAASTASSTSATGSAAPSTAPSKSTSDDAGTVWLCRPGLAKNPCTSDEAITQIAADGSRRVEHPKPATDPPVDCFYVYPTVSTQKTAVANLDIDPAETDVAVAQASRFSHVCRVFAPMYRQRTIGGIFGAESTPAEAAYAYDDVKAAWDDYLTHDNHGRGVIVIGHSQGSFVLTKLIQNEIDAKPSARKRLVSAMLLGGNVTVPDGKEVGGSFQHVPVCTTSTQTGCVVAYSTFSGTPVPAAIFGKSSAGTHVVCSNPAALTGGPATLHPAFVTGQSLLGSVDLKDAKVTTPWVGYPGLFSGECKSNADHTWLEITTHRSGPDDPRPELSQPLGPTWGLHLVDVNIAMGDLVGLARSQIHAYRR